MAPSGRVLELAAGIDRAQLVPFGALIYPPDRQARFRGRSFGRRPLAESVHVLTCRQFDAQSDGDVDLRETDYYHWTREKLNRFGDEYEQFLFAPDKGCAAHALDREATLALPTEERHDHLAAAATEGFRTLFKSVRDEGWHPERGTLPPTLFRLRGKKYTIHEGRHRLAVLRYLNPGDVTLRVDAGQIRTDWYRLRARRSLKRLLLRR